MRLRLPERVLRGRLEPIAPRPPGFGQARFERQLLIALSGLLVLTLYRQISDFAPFAISWYGPTKYGFVASYVLLAAICFWNSAATIFPFPNLEACTYSIFMAITC